MTLFDFVIGYILMGNLVATSISMLLWRAFRVEGSATGYQLDMLIWPYALFMVVLSIIQFGYYYFTRKGK